MILTTPGDVLILRTRRDFTVHVVGRVTRAGQQDFRGAKNLVVERTLDAAVERAAALVRPGRRILLNDIDTDEWSVIER
jgi:hypothetical protein